MGIVGESRINCTGASLGRVVANNNTGGYTGAVPIIRIACRSAHEHGTRLLTFEASEEVNYSIFYCK